MIAVQIFDQRKFKKRDQGFLGVVNVRVSDVLDLELGGHGASTPLLQRAADLSLAMIIIPRRDAHFGPEEVER